VLVDMDWWPLKNVWLGTSTERQIEADERIPDLLSTPAHVHFISAEPLLGAVDVSDFLRCPVCQGYGFTAKLGDKSADPCVRCLRVAAKYGKTPPAGGFAKLKVDLDWVIVGGESGPGARPMQPDWARFLRDQCQRAGVPFFLKQMARKKTIPDDLFIREMPAKEPVAA
jgi:protein gp37